jgi:hypothetical protein
MCKLLRPAMLGKAWFALRCWSAEKRKLGILKYRVFDLIPVNKLTPFSGNNKWDYKRRKFGRPPAQGSCR